MDSIIWLKKHIYEWTPSPAQEHCHNNNNNKQEGEAAGNDCHNHSSWIFNSVISKAAKTTANWQREMSRSKLMSYYTVEFVFPTIATIWICLFWSKSFRGFWRMVIWGWTLKTHVNHSSAQSIIIKICHSFTLILSDIYCYLKGQS